MGSSFDTVDFFPTDDALRGKTLKAMPLFPANFYKLMTFILINFLKYIDGLEPIDFDGFQILTNPNLVTDPSTEENFRLDRM